MQPLRFSAAVVVEKEEKIWDAHEREKSDEGDLPLPRASSPSSLSYPCSSAIQLTPALLPDHVDVGLVFLCRMASRPVSSLLTVHKI